MANEYGYTPAGLRNTLPEVIAAEPEAVQFGPFAGRVPAAHAAAVQQAQGNLALILDRINAGVGQWYVDGVAVLVNEWTALVYYVPSDWGCNEDDML